MKIGELAKATNTKVETVRYYEQIGMLPAPPRTSAWTCNGRLIACPSR